MKVPFPSILAVIMTLGVVLQPTYSSAQGSVAHVRKRVHVHPQDAISRARVKAFSAHVVSGGAYGDVEW